MFKAKAQNKMSKNININIKDKLLRSPQLFIFMNILIAP